MTEEAVEAWAAAYPELSAERPGLVGAIIARAEAQVIRLALIFALLDRRNAITLDIWRPRRRSGPIARHPLFGSSGTVWAIQSPMTSCAPFGRAAARV